jgi:hypothetical protein
MNAGWTTLKCWRGRYQVANGASAIGHGMTDQWDTKHASDMGLELDVP